MSKNHKVMKKLKHLPEVISSLDCFHPLYHFSCLHWRGLFDSSFLILLLEFESSLEFFVWYFAGTDSILLQAVDLLSTFLDPFVGYILIYLFVQFLGSLLLDLSMLKELLLFFQTIYS